MKPSFGLILYLLLGGYISIAADRVELKNCHRDFTTAEVDSVIVFWGPMLFGAIVDHASNKAPFPVCNK